MSQSREVQEPDDAERLIADHILEGLRRAGVSPERYCTARAVCLERRRVERKLPAKPTAPKEQEP